jgi:hypothetical protein
MLHIAKTFNLVLAPDATSNMLKKYIDLEILEN